MMGAGVLSCGEEIDRLQRTRIGCVQDRHTVTEHVSDIDVLPVEHHLHAVGPSADVAIGDVLDALADAFGGNVCLRSPCGPRPPRQRGGSEHGRQLLKVTAARELWHLFPPVFWRMMLASGEACKS